VRVVSLVPSLTEAVAATMPQVLVGVTDWCTHPPDLAAARVGGTKYPDLDRVLQLRPDIVLVNEEENRLSDAQALREAGIEVYVTYPRTVDEALDELGRMLARLGADGEPRWLADARTAWADLPPAETHRAVLRRAVIPVWRRPWVVLGPGTFAGDVLRRLGVTNVYGTGTNDSQADRYPRPSLADIRAHTPDLMVLPDEPYAFTADDGPESFVDIPCALVSGRHLTWYGPSLAEAPALLARQLGSTVTASTTGFSSA
jgi:ABC-type Fe3+-hydroxamate transport system substrate-binding protein